MCLSLSLQSCRLYLCYCFHLDDTFNFLRVALRWMPRCISVCLSLNNQRMFVPFFCYMLCVSFTFIFVILILLVVHLCPTIRVAAEQNQCKYSANNMIFVWAQLFFERWLLWQKAQTQTKYHLQIISNKKNNNSKAVISVSRNKWKRCCQFDILKKRMNEKGR